MNCTDGVQSVAPLVQGSDGNFYGTTDQGGVVIATGGTVFKITPEGTLTTLYNFCSQNHCTDGANPEAGLVQGTDGKLYGTTYRGGTSNNCSIGCGTIFSISTGGTLRILHSFDGTDGSSSFAGLVQDTSGKLYGTTSSGGASNYGTIFSLSVGLGPFVETNPTFGMVGAPVHILGTDLTGATSVTFNGTEAVFTVASDALITTTVPAGATTGTVNVTTPNGTLTSNAPFRVRP